jgi:hypothetical protein
VIRLRVFELRAEIDALTAQSEARRGELNGLLPCLADRRWPAAAAALLHYPEATSMRRRPRPKPRHKNPCVGGSVPPLGTRLKIALNVADGTETALSSGAAEMFIFR